MRTAATSSRLRAATWPLRTIDKTIYGFVWCSLPVAIKTVATGAPQAGITALAGDMDSDEFMALGSIGDITAMLGDINVEATAGQDIGAVTALVGSILGTSDRVDTATGTIVLGVSGSLVAGGDIGPLSANQGIGNYEITAGGNVLALTTTVGAIGAGSEEIVLVFDRWGGSYGTTPITRSVLQEIGLLRVTAGGDIGPVTSGLSVDGEFVAGGSILDVTALTDIGARLISAEQPTLFTAGASIGVLLASTGEIGPIVVHAGDDIDGVLASLDIGGEYVAEQGDIGTEATDGVAFRSDAGDIYVWASAGDQIGDIVADLGDIDGDYEAVNEIGNVTAAENILGSYLVAEGPIGDLVSTAGDIAVTIAANGGVEIDDATLEYVHWQPNEDIPVGVGRIYAEIGNVSVDIQTGGSVGLTSDDQVLGGIAAPLGSINATLRVGGHVGGLSAQSVYLSPDSVILGSIGILRGLDSGGGTVDHVDANNPLVIIGDGVDYRVEVDSGTASVTYGVVGGTVVFDAITYTPEGGESAGIYVLTTTGGRTALLDASERVTVESMVVHGDVANIEVEGDLDSLTVNGDLAGGVLHTEGAVGSVLITGDLGSSTSTYNPFVADDMAIHVDEFAPTVFSLEVLGTNYGLVNVSLPARHWISWQNTMDFNDEGDDYITVFLGSGTAQLRINNGFLERVDIADGRASNLVVLTSDSTTDDTDDVVPTRARDIGGASGRMALRELRLQRNLVARGINGVAIGTSREVLNQVFEGGSTSIGDDDTAHVGIITGEGGAALKLSNVVVEGDVRTIDGSVIRSVISNVTIAGSVDEVLANTRLVGLDVRGDAGIVEFVRNVDINGSVGRMQATRSITRVNVGGNAGIVSSGGLIRRVSVGGSMVSLSASRMTDVEVGGSVGAEVTGSSPGLGSAFGLSEIAELLGTSEAGLLDIADHGPGDSHYVGGIEANRLYKVSVGGGISDLVVRQLGRRVRVSPLGHPGRANEWLKVDGQLLVTPNMDLGQTLASLFFL